MPGETPPLPQTLNAPSGGAEAIAPSAGVTPNQPPAAIKEPIERLDQVVTGLRQREEQAHTDKEMASAHAAAEKAKAEEQQVKLQAQHEKARGRFLGLGKLFGEGKRTQESAQAAALVAEAQKLSGLAEQLDTNLQQALGSTASELYQYRDLMVRLENLIEANLRGGPFETSPQMTEALKQQDAKAVYAELNMGEIPASRTLSMEQINSLRDHLIRIDITDYYHDKTYLELPPKEQARVDSELKSIAPMYEAALEYADQNHIPVDQRQISRCLHLGIDIMPTMEDNWQSLHSFVREKTGIESKERVERDEVDWVYTVGAFALDNFFADHRISMDQAVPYIIAFSAGVNSSPSAMPRGLAEAMRGWIADTIPVPRYQYRREGEEWVKKEVGIEPRGLGSLLEHERSGDYEFPWLQAMRFDKTCTDETVAAAMNKALGPVKQVHEKMQTRRTPYEKIGGRLFELQKEIAFIKPV